MAATTSEWLTPAGGRIIRPCTSNDLHAVAYSAGLATGTEYVAVAVAVAPEPAPALSTSGSAHRTQAAPAGLRTASFTGHRPDNSEAALEADPYDAPMATDRHPAVARIVQEHGAKLVDVLSAQLSGADLTALLLEVAHRRSAAVTPADVLAQYERDRFVGPSRIDGRRLLDTEHRAVTAIGESFDVVGLAPLTPLGAHSVVAGVSQNRVITTVRNIEVAADPTNSLALEAAIRRRELLRRSARSSESVKLAAVQRVTRAQHFDEPMSFAHFSLLGTVIAGRDIGDARFEHAALVEMLAALANVVRAIGADDVAMSIHDFDGRFQSLINHATNDLEVLGVHTTSDPDRTTGAGYYPSICFKVDATFGAESIEVGDGGFVPWTQRLLSNAKERLLIGGLGLDRLALLRQPLPWTRS